MIQDFARDLEEAILLAGCGKWKRLREVLEDPEQGEEVLQICQLLDEELGQCFTFEYCKEVDMAMAD